MALQVLSCEEQAGIEYVAKILVMINPYIPFQLFSNQDYGTPHLRDSYRVDVGL